MSHYNSNPDLLKLLADMRTRLSALENTKGVSVCTTATKPGSVGEGTIIFVSDAAAGSKFQGWDGSGWVSLG